MSRGLTGIPAAGVTTRSRDDIATLIKRARDLDTIAWERLYQLAFPQVYRYVSAKVRCSADAEDITEEVFLGALQTVASLRAPVENGFLGWLFQIARFKIADHLRRQYRRPTDPLEPDMDFVDPAPNFLGGLGSIERRGSEAGKFCEFY